MLKRVAQWVVATGVATALIGCALPLALEGPPGRRMLGSLELERLFHADRTVEFVSPEGSAVVTYSPSGEQRIEWANGTDTGTFRIREDHFCSRWKTLRNGAESCNRVLRISESEFDLVDDNGAYAATMRLK
jgi:hypothetical protein